MITRDTNNTSEKNDDGNKGNGETGTPTPKKSSSRKWICPKCGMIARTTKDTWLICGYCNVSYIRA